MRPVQFVECELTTDFGLLYAAQTQGTGLNGGSFATSLPGAVAMSCGTRYADCHVRLERWDERPPAPTDDWEDIDELPWVTVPGGGSVVVSGFDPPEGDAGLVVDDLHRARAQVLAKGRHRYSRSDEVPDHLPPERWLLRWWPDDHASDALAGPPRRLAGPPPFWVSRTAWRAALHGWAQTGWQSALRNLLAFDEIYWALLRLGRPSSVDELAEVWGPWGATRDEHGPYDLQNPVLGELPNGSSDYVDQKLEALARIAAAAGMASIDTFGDALVAMRRLELLLAAEGRGPERYGPNPSPTPAWDVAQFADRRHVLIKHALDSDYAAYEPDIVHLLNWAPGGRLTTSPTAMAVRLALPLDDVLGTLRLLEHQERITVESPDEHLQGASEIALSWRPRGA